MGLQSFQHTLTIAIVMDAATKAVSNNAYTKLGEWVVPAQNSYGMGFGEQSGQQNARGRLFVDIKDNGVAPGVNVEGVLRIMAIDANDSPIGPNGGVVGEWRTETLRSSSGDRTLQLPFPEHGLFLTEDNKFIFEFKADAAAATLGQANSKALIDVTKERR
jgi:hypothetical protein